MERLDFDDPWQVIVRDSLGYLRIFRITPPSETPLRPTRETAQQTFVDQKEAQLLFQHIGLRYRGGRIPMRSRSVPRIPRSRIPR